MDIKSKPLFILMIVLCVISIATTYYRTIIKQNFEITNIPEEDIDNSTSEEESDENLEVEIENFNEEPVVDESQ